MGSATHGTGGLVPIFGRGRSEGFRSKDTGTRDFYMGTELGCGGRHSSFGSKDAKGNGFCMGTGVPHTHRSPLVSFDQTNQIVWVPPSNVIPQPLSKGGS